MSSRIMLAAGLLALAIGARAADAKPDAKPDVCPDLSGTFACPAVERYKQKAMTITVKDDPAAKTYEFSYGDGSPAVKISADGKRKRSGKTWSSYVCRQEALIQIVFSDAKTKKSSGGSKQRLDKDGSYEVSGPDGKVTLLCPRAKAP